MNYVIVSPPRGSSLIIGFFFFWHIYLQVIFFVQYIINFLLIDSLGIDGSIKVQYLMSFLKILLLFCFYPKAYVITHGMELIN